MTLPNFQALTGVAANNGAALAINWPTHAINDVALVWCEASGNSAVITVPAGWELLGDVRDVSTIAGSRFHCIGRRATSGAEGSVTFPLQADNKHTAMTTYRGVHPGIPVASFVFATATKTPASSTAPTAASVTTLSRDCMVAMGVTRPNDAAGAAFSPGAAGNLSSVTERADDGSITGNGGGLMVADGTLVVAGSIGAPTFSQGALSTTNCMISVVLPGIVLPPHEPFRQPRGNINNNRFY
jgi:hypothetical protein